MPGADLHDRRIRRKVLDEDFVLELLLLPSISLFDLAALQMVQTLERSMVDGSDDLFVALALFHTCPRNSDGCIESGARMGTETLWTPQKV